MNFLIFYELSFDISEIHKYQKKVDGWDIVKTQSNIFMLEKSFSIIL